MNWSTPKNKSGRKSSLSVLEMTLFGVLGGLMFCSKLFMDFLPNIHLLGMFTMVFALVFRKKALVPIYVFVMLTGVYGGFSLWWVPHLYLWVILWGVTMLLPPNLSPKWATVVYPVICGAFGFLYGTLYAPAQAILFGLNWKQMIAWIITGLPFDAIHGVSNLIAGLLVLPLSVLLRKLAKNIAKI